MYHRWCSVTWMFHIYNKTLSFLQFSAVKIGPLVLYVWFLTFGSLYLVSPHVVLYIWFLPLVPYIWFSTSAFLHLVLYQDKEHTDHKPTINNNNNKNNTNSSNSSTYATISLCFHNNNRTVFRLRGSVPHW